ncbi:MAG: M14 family metallopeptidase, partial [Pseudomonadota bacterium]
MLRLLLALLVLFLFTSLSAEELIRNYKVPFNVPASTMKKVAESFEVVKRLPDGFEVYVQETQEKNFLKIIPQAMLLEKDIHAYVKSLQENKSPILDAYHTYPQVENELRDWVKKFPQLAQLETYGKTTQGRTLYALKLSAGLKQDKPQLMITAATHGDELITVEVLLALVKELLEGYGKDQRLSKMLDSHIIYSLPVTSPDGFSARQRYVQGKDPNRVFPWPENLGNKPIDCIDAWMKYADSHKIAGSIDLHAYGRLAMYPWGYTEDAPNTDTNDELEMKNLVEKMAERNNYTAGQISTT